MDSDGDAFARLFTTAILWGSWCVVHSLLNEEGPIRKTGILDTGFKRYYRLAYSIFAALSLTGLWWITPWDNGKALWQWTGNLHYIRLLLAIVGIILLILSFQYIGFIDFLGLRALGTHGNRKRGRDRLITWGIYGWIRHPQFLGGLMLLWARDLKRTDFVINIVLSAYLIIGAHIEEKRLLAKFGKQYVAYMKKVPRFLPIPRSSAHTDPGPKD
ncbi:methyltransferase family protein [Desulfomonile tiedjei]|uniref:Uncharacterized protein n=1 Tax=Desulfomonile tiedjei (strain ATCC 49306 / DSM 6799 / DCB-1) TaxID=706587 RepID=I4CBZ8_DESTA|nr:isoprenylcysteine carboxylmethyltransferase family protein [Desulfomonile tiedjei]AFM27089.1 hypothetical protein Desti_4457 [Desulfomonile tiedjei DSM 6799]